MISNLDIFIPFYTCKKGIKIHIKLLQDTIASVRKEGIDNIKVIDGSLNTRLEESDVDVEIIRNDGHGLAPAINIIIENATEDFLCLMPTTLVGVGNIERMVLEKKIVEEKLGKPVCLVDDAFYYPTNDEWLLGHIKTCMSQRVEWVKKELTKMGFEYTNDGQAIAKDKVGSEWEYCYYIGPNFLVNKDKLFEVGGADERCVFHRHGDTDLAFRWLSFEYLLLFANSAKMHRLHATTKLLCKEIDEEERKTGYFDQSDKYTVATKVWWSERAEYRRNPSLYRKRLKKPYQKEYDQLRKEPFILGREG